MADTKRQRLERMRGQLDSERQSFVTHWRNLADYVLPRQQRFLATDRNRLKSSVNNLIVNNTATLSTRTLSSGMMAGITSPARPWFTFTMDDTALAELGPVKEWLSVCAGRMREVFLRSNLYNILPMMYSDLGVFGTTACAVLEDREDVIRLYHFPIGSYMLSNSPRYQVDTLVREYQMTVRQLVEEFGEDNVSDTVRSQYQNNSKENWVDVVHVVYPNEDYDEAKPASKFKAWASCYYEKSATDGKFLREAGFDEFPCLAPRWLLMGEDVYGSSCPGMDALGDIKALQLEEKRKAQAIEKMVNPPMVAPSSMRNSRASVLPGDVTYLDIQSGQQGFKPAYEVNPRINELMMDIQQNEQRIRRAFFEDLFLMIANDTRSNITAREIEERHEEKLLMLGPVLERLNDELLDPLIDRTFSIMLKNKLLPPPPKELQGMPIKVEYTSIMAQAMKLVGLGSMERFAGFVGNIAAAKPETLDKVDFDQMVDVYGDSVGLPPNIVVPDDKVAEIRAARAKQQQQMQQMEQMAAMAQVGQQAAQGMQAMSAADMESDNALTRMLGIA